MRVANIVAAGFDSPWAMLAHLPRGTNPRYNEFAWEFWHECDVFRARVEAKLKR